MPFKILSPCGMLGYGYPEASFANGIAQKPDAIVVDAGSTDAGPHKLGAGVSIVSRAACKKDLVPMLTHGARLKIPVIIGSAGGAGARVHVQWTLDVVKEVLAENDLTGLKVAVIWADIPHEAVGAAVRDGKAEPLGKAVPELTAETLARTGSIVAQMGDEPIIEALKQGADVVICGRAYDPSPFAAPAILHGYNAALAYHLGKILECAALCATPGTTKDCMLGILGDDYFDVVPLNKVRVCTKTSVAAHTFYEKDNPCLLKGPGLELHLEDCTFTENGDGSVRVTGSQLVRSHPYKIKLEGAAPVGYRSFVIAGVRDPLLISMLEEVQALVKQQVQDYFKEIEPSQYQINFINYGINGIMGSSEPNRHLPHEVGCLFEVIAPQQEMANNILSNLRSTFLHYGYEGRKSTAGNLAFPFAPSDISFGKVYEFSVYHLMETADGLEFFPIEWV